MRKHFIACVVTIIVLGISSRAAATPCGSFEFEYGAAWLHQIDRVDGFATTLRSAFWQALCGGAIYSEVYVQGYYGYDVDHSEGTTATAVFRVEPTFTGFHYAHTKHWYIDTSYHWSLLFQGLGDVWAQHTCEEPPGGCQIEGSVWDSVNCECTTGCPLLLDTEGDGFKLTSRENGVYFDLNSDGNPELISWTEADSDDGWLVLDRNGNGKIDSGRELFGNFTSIHNNSLEPIAEHGFQALRGLEGPSWGTSILDGVIDVRDAAFASLQVWRDTNHNGISEAAELTPINSLGVVRLDTDFQPSKHQDEHGNTFKMKAPSYWRLPDGAIKRRIFWDVYLLLN